jgi:hypothetical protein
MITDSGNSTGFPGGEVDVLQWGHCHPPRSASSYAVKYINEIQLDFIYKVHIFDT